jgi:hypothetical protein
MRTPATVDGLQARREQFSLDARARSLMRETSPAIAPHLDAAIDNVVLSAGSIV